MHFILHFEQHGKIYTAALHPKYEQM